ncbi:MAG: histidine kinase [Bacteroidota bacterium]
MSKTEKFLPFILAAVVPAISTITNPMRPEVDLSIFALRYLQTSSLLLILWYLNKWILNTNLKLKRLVGLIPFTASINFSVIGLAVFSNDFLLSIGLKSAVEMPALFPKLVLVALIYNVILRVFKAQKERSQLEVQNLSLQAENLKFQIETLKQQINPHFLFNSLNTLLDLIEEDKNAAIKYIRNFSNLYRVVLLSTKLDFIPLSDELKFLNDYWSLLKVRFNDAIELKLDVSEDKMDLLIPPLCLQFLIENAVKHNQASKKRPLQVEVHEENNWLVVKNQINPIMYPVVGEKVGLKNLQERFTLLHRSFQYGIENTYFIVRISLKTL